MTAAAAATDDDGWVKQALKDDVAVVDVLLRLKLSQPPPTSNRSHSLPSLCWSVRQRRSRNVPRHHHADDVFETKSNKKKGESSSAGATASPTTPLSWSVATSVSGGGGGGHGNVDGSEESSKPTKPSDAARSKVAVRSETTIFKRPGKKKTLAELKEEESLLLKERTNLKNELETLRLTVEKERATNESLKMKLDIQLQQQTLLDSMSGEPVWRPQSSCPPNSSCKVQEAGSRDAAFSLPDLNLPFGDDPRLTNSKCKHEDQQPLPSAS